jgi:hypothetical protein
MSASDPTTDGLPAPISQNELPSMPAENRPNNVSANPYVHQEYDILVAEFSHLARLDILDVRVRRIRWPMGVSWRR